MAFVFIDRAMPGGWSKDFRTRGFIGTCRICQITVGVSYAELRQEGLTAPPGVAVCDSCLHKQRERLRKDRAAMKYVKNSKKLLAWYKGHSVAKRRTWC